MALVAPATEIVTAIDQFFRVLRLNEAVRKEFDQLITERGKVPPAYFSLSRVIANTGMPVLWVHDRDDDITPLADVQPVIDRHYPHLDFIITKGLGHRRIYRDSSVVKAVTEVLGDEAGSKR